ncbi:granzyme A-like [Mugil cephalus]|uniref:granzyme A-like n=1 Tax=Mugil cephalus TaxID=48193 RepID=UPI001FB70450|nr:granzyme A-like [Mugil cephalus]
MSRLRDFSVFVPCVFLLIVQSSHGTEIIGGKVVESNSLPFMARLENKTSICGGVLIDPKWVLTAARCNDIKKVMLGVHSIKAKEKNARQVLKVKKGYRHPCYNEKEHVNDLMLLKLDKPAKETKTVKCINLGNSFKEPMSKSTCLVAGWGKTKNNAKTMSDVLMSVNVTVIDRRDCNSPKYYNYDPIITNSMICAGNSNADTCEGDLGGPLLCNGALVGISSLVSCGKKPGLYTYLTEKHLSWIKKTMKGPGM